MAAQLDKVDPARAHELRADIAEQQKDYAARSSEYKQAIAASPHPASQWTVAGRLLSQTASAGRRWKRRSTAAMAAERDKDKRTPAWRFMTERACSSRRNRDPALAAKMLEDYLAGRKDRGSSGV